MPASKSLITKTPEETRQAVKKLQDEGATKIQVTPIRTPGKSNGRLDAKKENKKNKQKEKNSTDPDPKTQAEGVRQGQDESRNKGGGVENLGNGEETSDDTKGGGNIEPPRRKVRYALSARPGSPLYLLVYQAMGIVSLA